MTEREFATDVVQRLQTAGFQALWAGGCVRDEILGLTPADYDVASDARPEQVQQLFRRCILVGASFGVVEVLGPRDSAGEWLKVQVATFRSDGAYTDERHPDEVTFSTPEEDAQRRDFTINGMFFDPLKKEVIDFVDGQADLSARILRAIGDPTARFTEDKLRVLRAVRMAARFELTIDPKTLSAAQRMAERIRVVSVERIAEEFRKMLVNQHRVRAIALLNDFDLVSPILPELPKKFDERILRIMGAFTGPVSFPLAFAVLLSGLSFKVVTAIARRLKLANVETDRVAWLVANEQFLFEAASLPMRKLQPVLVHAGIDELLTLSRTVASATGLSVEPLEFAERILRTTPAAELNPVPLVTGDDLLEMGLKPGPEFKRILDAIRDRQLDGELRSADDARRFVQNR